MVETLLKRIESLEEEVRGLKVWLEPILEEQRAKRLASEVWRSREGAEPREQQAAGV